MQGTCIYYSYTFLYKHGLILSYSHISTTLFILLFSTQIIFEAIRGDDWSSDIALDDVILSVGACSEGKSI